MATYFAQAAGAIQSIEWDTAPTGGGTDLVWANLDPADVLCANGKAITWAAASVPTLTCARLSTTGEGTGTAGGGFALSGSTAVTIGTALHPTDLTAGTTICLTSTHTGTGVNAVTVNGNVTGGSGSYAHGARNNGTGTLTITGAVTGGSEWSACGAWNNDTGTLTINGNVTGSSVSTAYGAVNNGTGTLTITGAVTGGSGESACGAWNMGAGTLTVNGNVTGGSGEYAHGAWNDSTGTLTINGNVTGGSGQEAIGAYNSVTGTVTINGTVAATSTARAFGAYNNSTGVITVIGSLVDTELCGAYYGAIFWQPVAGVHYHKVFHSAGAAKYYAPSPAQTDVRDGIFAGFSDGVAYNGNVVLPSAGDVRLGVDFDYPGKETGTLHLPAEADVKTGVGYGVNGTEYEGTLAAGGGGVPLIGPGGLVG